MHHLSHSPVLHTFCDHTRMFCIKGRYIYVPLFCCFVRVVKICYLLQLLQWAGFGLGLSFYSLHCSPFHNFPPFYLWQVNGINFIYQLLNLFTGFRDWDKIAYGINQLFAIETQTTVILKGKDLDLHSMWEALFPLHRSFPRPPYHRVSDAY